MRLFSVKGGSSGFHNHEPEQGCAHGGLWPWRYGSGNDRNQWSTGEGLYLSIGLKLKTELEKKGYQVVTTREKDEGLYEETSVNKKVQDMQNRILLMQEVKPVLTVSIHQNSYEDPNVKGPQVFYYKDSPEGEALAVILQRHLNEKLKVERPREAKGNTSYYLLKRSPGVLNIVECGFLTNPEEAQKLADEEYQKLVAEAIAEGIEEYLQNG